MFSGRGHFFQLGQQRPGAIVDHLHLSLEQLKVSRIPDQVRAAGVAGNVVLDGVGDKLAVGHIRVAGGFCFLHLVVGSDGLLVPFVIFSERILKLSLIRCSRVGTSAQKEEDQRDRNE